MGHYHVLTAGMDLCTILSEFQFDELMDATLIFTSLIQSFHGVSFPLEKVYDRFQAHLMVQDAVIVEGGISLIMQQCTDKCIINKSGRN